MVFLAPLLAFVAACAAAMHLITLYMRRVADLMLTDKFRAAESIANGRIPRRWVAQIDHRPASRWPACLRIPRGRRELLALSKLDALIGFFASSPFVDGEETRGLLLARLGETRDAWSHLTWEEIMARYGGDPQSG